MGETAPGTVNFADLFADTISEKMPNNAEKMLGVAWGTIFAVMQQVDPVYDEATATDGTIVQIPVWPIEAEESERLGKATGQLLGGLPAKEKKSVAKFLNKHAGWISFAIVVSQVAGPRAKFSLDQKKANSQYVSTLDAKASPNARSEPARGSAETARDASSGPVSAARATAHPVSAFFDGVS